MKGLYFLSQAVAVIMKNQGGGKIINVGSINGFKPEPFVSIYSASKAGAHMISKAFAAELAPYNIQVNAIVPGPISSKMLDSHWWNLSPEEAKKEKEKLSKLLPMKRVGTPDDIAGAAIYLASAASNYTTGAEIIVDGGASLLTKLSVDELQGA
jgi:2-deoxy-D-gluconate 3-dehydrogenase